MTLPITIVGGYLGAGKTTLINHLLRNADGLRLAILVNEFGELPIDQDLIEAEGDDIIAIAGGCVCCSYGNDLTLALLDLQKLTPAPDHVLLEASGVALPGAIASSVSLLPGYALDGVVVLMNAETIREQAADTYIGDTVQRQMSDADLLILNKSDLIAENQIEGMQNWTSKAAPHAQCVVTSQGVVPGSVILQSFLERNYNALYHSHVADHFTTHSLRLEHPVNAEKLAGLLAAESAGLVRAKGFVSTQNAKKKTIQTVGRRWSVSDAPPGTKDNLVVIGPSVNTDRQKLELLIKSCAIK